jgi:hypothetical protein
VRHVTTKCFEQGGHARGSIHLSKIWPLGDGWVD